MDKIMRLIIATNIQIANKELALSRSVAWKREVYKAKLDPERASVCRVISEAYKSRAIELGAMI